MSKESVMKEFGLTEAQYWEYKKKAEDETVKLFGKSARDMSDDELLFALGCISNKLYHETGKKKYKDMENESKRIMEELHGNGETTRSSSKGN